MFKNILLIIILVWEILFFTSCSKNEGRSSEKEISVMNSVPDDCSSFIKIDSNGYYYYKCPFWNSEKAISKIDVSDEKIIATIEKMRFEDWNRLAKSSYLDCKAATKNVFVVEIKEKGRSKSYLIDGRLLCNDKYKFLDELNSFFLKM
jgi:hypothetical protein